MMNVNAVRLKKSVFLILFMLMLVALFVGVISENAAAMDSKYQAFISDARFCDGVAWGNGQTPKLVNRPYFIDCAAYCLDFVYYCFGTDNPRSADAYTDAAETRAGDIVTYGDQYDGSGHWFVVLERSGNKLHVAEGNFNKKVRIGWNYTVSGSKINGKTILAYHFAAKDESSTVSFYDVNSDDYFYDAVYWAVAKGITSGTSDTTFSPYGTCTREQTVTFLWRAAGQPQPNSTVSPFIDVTDSTRYSYKAILWAAEQGITAGTSVTTFSPYQSCTRGQVVTFLWRANGKPQVAAVQAFRDVYDTDYYFYPVIWAVQKGITRGTTDFTFSPNGACQRAHIVCFLYRCYK